MMIRNNCNLIAFLNQGRLEKLEEKIDQLKRDPWQACSFVIVLFNRHR